jgi:uncharacterized membrane protein
MVVTAVCAAAVFLPLEPFQTMAAIVFVFVLPGLLAGRALFPDADIDWATRVLISLSLSVAIVVLDALLLDLTFGLSRGSWVLSIAAVDVAACAVAISHKPLSKGRRTATASFRMRRRDVVFVVFALALLSAAVALAVTPLGAKYVDGYTALWIQPVRHRTAVRVAVRSAERETLTYRLVVRFRHRNLDVRRFRLRPGAAAVRILAVPARGGRVVAVLYRVGQKKPYRNVRIVIPRRP